MNLLSGYKVIDGGLATELVRKGYDFIDDDPLWSARLLHSHPEAIEDVHLSFLEAGADVIITASYQASVAGFVENLHITEDAARSLIRKSVELAQSAREKFLKQRPVNAKASEKPLIAGSVGPYGACLYDGSEYTGAYIQSISAEELAKWHRERMQILVEAGVDFLGLESIPVKAEADVLVKLLEEMPGVKAWLTFTCKDGLHTSHGETIADAVSSALNSKQIFGIGINCTSPVFVESLLQKLTPLKDHKLIVVYPNSGETWTEEKRWRQSDAVESLYCYVPTWLKSGASWIGGCCRTTPDDIKNIRSTITEFQNQT